MSTDPDGGGVSLAGAGGEVRREYRRLRYVEFGLAVAVWTGVAMALSAAVAVGVGGGLATLKNLLFVPGMTMFGVGAIEMRPPAPYREEKRFSIAPDEPGRIRALVDALPPLRDRVLPDDQRVGPGPKLFCSGLLVLAISFTMEVVLGIGA
jgi:hypothetical protein